MHFKRKGRVDRPGGAVGNRQQWRPRDRLERRERMASFVLHQGATVLCAHGGAAVPLPPPPTANGPCATGHFTTTSTRVRVMGTPVLLKDSASVCVPTGTPLRPV